MPKCDLCGRVTTALHTGGDGAIPGDGVNGGLCDSCQVEAATISRAVRAAKLKAKVDAAVAAATGGT